MSYSGDFPTPSWHQSQFELVNLNPSYGIQIQYSIVSSLYYQEVNYYSCNVMLNFLSNVCVISVLNLLINLH